MHCNKWLVTQPPFPPMGLDRDIFHICRLPHIFHFSISVDLRAAFIQLAALAYTLFSGPGTKPMLSRSSQTEPWFPPFNTCRLVRPGFARPWPRSPFSSLAGPGLAQTWPWELRPPPPPRSHGDPGHGTVCHWCGHHPLHGSSQTVWHLGAHVLIWR